MNISRNGTIVADALFRLLTLVRRGYEPGTRTNIEVPYLKRAEIVGVAKVLFVF